MHAKKTHQAQIILQVSFNTLSRNIRWGQGRRNTLGLIFRSWVCKINKQKPQISRVRRPEGGAPTPCHDSKAQGEEERHCFPGKDSANEKPWTLCLLQPSQLPFPLFKGILLPLLCQDLYLSCHGCRPQIAILC